MSKFKVGKDADLVFLKDVSEYSIGKPHGLADYSVYEGFKVKEKILHTMVRGKFVVKDGEFVSGNSELINCSEELL